MQAWYGDVTSESLYELPNDDSDDRSVGCLHHVQVYELLLVSWDSPFSFFDHGLDGLPDVRVSLTYVVEGEVLEWSSLLDVGQRFLELLELNVDLRSGFLSLLNGLGLERLDGFHVGARVVSNRLELFKCLCGLIDDGGVLEDRAVVVKVDSRRLGESLVVKTLGFGMAFAEGLERSDGLLAQTKGGVQTGKVDGGSSSFSGGHWW
jgi:hypothetical protein